MARRALSVVVPVYNSAPGLEALVTRIHAALADFDVELVLVNDGSADDSWARIVELAERHAGLRGFNLARNFGQHNALLAGIRAARSDVVVTLDDDLQYPPEDVPRLLAELDAGADVVYGTPVDPEYGLWRNVGTRMTKTALRYAIGNELAVRVSAFRVFRTRLRDAFTSFAGPDVSIDVLLTWATSRFSSVPIVQNQREVGRSSYTLGRLATHALTMLTGFSTRPLRIASLVGLAATLFGLAVLVLVVVRYFVEGESPRGFAFLASIIAIFSGAQLLTLGIIGEYLARMHVRIMERPSYAILDQVESGAPVESDARPL
jgi:undecaprenyl-phosphate 4-deoxy-4-formamido-L-arabinose transferase